MKIYTKQYEDYYRRSEELSRSDPDKVTVQGNKMSPEEFLLCLNDEGGNFRAFLWSFFVKLVYLKRLYWFNFDSEVGELFESRRQSGSFNAYMRLFTNSEPQFILQHPYFKVAESYIDEFYANIMEYSPFEYEYEFPYQFMTVDCLFFVMDMEERRELLSVGEEKCLKYADFCDYVINYTQCENEQLETPKFSLSEAQNKIIIL